jgi:hypothetical protein
MSGISAPDSRLPEKFIQIFDTGVLDSKNAVALSQLDYLPSVLWLCTASGREGQKTSFGPPVLLIFILPSNAEVLLAGKDVRSASLNYV